MEPLPEEVEGGVIVRDADGNPTGALLRQRPSFVLLTARRCSGVFLDNAQDLVIRPEPTYKQLQKRFASTVKDAHSLGLTSVHDAGFNPVSLEFFRR